MLSPRVYLEKKAPARRPGLQALAMSHGKAPAQGGKAGNERHATLHSLTIVVKHLLQIKGFAVCFFGMCQLVTITFLVYKINLLPPLL